MASKGKQVAGKASAGKRKRGDSDKSGGRKKNNSGALQFFDIAADVVDNEDSEDSDFDNGKKRPQFA